MKKVIALVAVILCCSMSTLMAQPPGGGGPQQDPAARAAAMKERLKPLGLTDVQADSVIAVFTDRSFMANMGNMRDMSPEDRQAAMKTVSEARAKRLEKTLGAEATKKVVELMSQRGPGGGGGGRQGGGQK